MATKKQTIKNSTKPEMEGPLNELFIDELKDIYWAENALVKALKKMAKASTAPDLRKAFESHLVETEGQLERLDKVFNSIGEKAAGKKCEAMAGLVKEAEALIEDTEKGTEVRDVALISAAQKVEHYEIASYGTLKALAGVLGYTEAEQWLGETLEEEKSCDIKLTDLAVSWINEAAHEEVG